jgi:hypothetical protein
MVVVSVRIISACTAAARHVKQKCTIAGKILDPNHGFIIWMRLKILPDLTGSHPIPAGWYSSGERLLDFPGVYRYPWPGQLIAFGELKSIP